MVTQSKAHGLARRLLITMLFSAVSVQAQQCVMQSKTARIAKVSISERSQMQQEIVPDARGGQRCLVNIRARVNTVWYTGFGEQSLINAASSVQACDMARVRADQSVLQQASPVSVVATDQVLICRDDPTLDQVQKTTTGTQAKLAQFRPHPDYPKLFHHNGTQCRWFLDTPAWNGKNIRVGQGIICHVKDEFWIVVDKF
jgi:hypothetical protein